MLVSAPLRMSLLSAGLAALGVVGGSGGPSLGGPSDPLHIAFESAERGFALSSLRVTTPDGTSTEFVVPPRPWIHGVTYDSLWWCEVMSTNQSVDLASSSAGTRSWRAVGERAIALRWDNISLPDAAATADVVLTVELSQDGSRVTWDPVFTNRAPGVGLAQFSLWVARLSTATPQTDVLFIPAGFGALFTNPSESLPAWPCPGCGGAYQSNYPETLWQLQYLAFFSGRSGLYFGIHDPRGSMKTLRMGTAEKLISPAVYLPGGNASTLMRFMLPPEGIGEPTPSWRMPAPLTIAALHGGEAETMWYDAAQIYRSWVLPHSTWTQRGPLSQRDEFTHGGWGDVDWWMHSTVTFSLPMAVDPPEVIANNSLALCKQLDACDSLAFNCENNLCLSCVPSRRAR